jgi:anti-anti-sigma regulatory factor
MRLSVEGNLIIETVARGVRVLRFARPDLRASLDEEADIGHSPLSREFQDTVLPLLAEGHMLVVNLSLAERFPTALYRWLLFVRQAVLAHRGRLVLCRVNPEHQEIFQLFQAHRVFTILPTEAEAVRAGEARRRDLDGEQAAKG